VTIRYNSQEKSECETGIKLNLAILHLPTEVEINTAPYCDSVRFFRNKKILAEQHAYAVELHFFLNGFELENPTEVVVTNRISKNTFHSVQLPVKDGLLLVPEKMANGTELELQARIGQDIVDIPGIPPSQLENVWTIRLADEKFKFENTLPKGMHWKSACIVAFDPLEGDGIQMSVDPCRKHLSKSLLK
jgi:hypothetical protein